MSEINFEGQSDTTTTHGYARSCDHGRALTVPCEKCEASMGDFLPKDGRVVSHGLEGIDQNELAEALMDAYRADEKDPEQLARAEVGFALAKQRDAQREACTCRCHQGWRQRITAHGYRSCPCERWPE